jgi:hypothetical protein
MRKLELITETTTGGGGVTTTYNQMNLESGSTSTVTNTLIPGDGTTAWTNQLGDVTTSLGKVVRTNDSPLSLGQMASFGSLPANTDGYLEFVGAYKSGRSSGGYFMGGFSLTPGGSDWNDIEYRWYYEGPQNRISVAYPSTTRNNAATNYSITDVLKIERTIVGGVGTVKFYRNGTLFYTHPTTTTAELFFKIDINRYMGADSLKIVYDTTTGTTYNDRIDLGNSVENGVKTTEFWFKLPATTTASTPKFSMLSSYDVSNSERGRQIVSIDNGIIDWEVFTTGTASVSINSDAGVYFNAGQYYHLALLNNGGLISIYVDSVLQSGGAGCPITALKTVAVDTYINGLFNPLSQIGDFTIKNLQYWNIVRTPAEITADKDVYYPSFTTGLSESWHFNNTTGANTVGVSGTTAIITTDTGGVTRINNIIRENFNHTSSGSPTTVIDTQEFDLFVGEAINVKTQGVNIDNISNTESGTTNSFQLPTTANNNKIFDYLNLVGSVSDFPYKDNYVKYSESGVELITNGRLKVNEMSKNGYKVEVLHGINDFFDKIRGKFLYEAYEPFRSTLTEMRYQDTTLCNTTAVRDAEGYCVPLMDLAGVNPIADFQQTVGYFLDFGLNKISDAIGYTYTNNGIDLTDYVFTKSEPPTFDTRVTSFVSNRYFAGYEEIVQENRLVWSHVMTVKGVINFQQMRMRVIAGVGLPNDPDINVMVNGVLLSAYTLGVGGAALNTTLTTTPIEYNAGDVIQIYFDATGIGSGNSVYLVDAYFQGYYTLGYKVYHENILGDYNQTDFVKNIMQTFNLGINVNSISKEVELYSLNTVYGNGGVINDFSKYYDETKKRIFKSSYGKNNKFTYKYIEKDVSFVKSDGILVANNTNEDKTIIESELTASSNYTPLTLGAIDALLTSVIAYDSKSVNAKPTNIGDRFNQVIRVEDTVADPVTVSYIDKNGTTGNVTSDQSFLTFGGLDWNTLIDTQFNNLRDKVLNRYEKYTVIMNVPLHVINEYDFKEKVYIKELGSNFVVNNITTLNGGLNQWELIKIN